MINSARGGGVVVGRAGKGFREEVTLESFIQGITADGGRDG